MARKQLTPTEEGSLNRLINRDFNQVRLQNMAQLFPNYYENILGDYDEEDYGNEIIWNWVYEAKDSYIAEKIIKNADKITNKVGVVIVDLSNEIEDEFDTGVFIGFSGAGYSFYDSHWYPLFKIIYPDLDKWYKDFG
jgi:hypothetical protein